MKRFKSKFLTKLFEIINSKVSFSENKEPEDIEEQYNFHLDDQAKYQRYQQWKKNRYDKRRIHSIDDKRNFKVISSRFYSHLFSNDVENYSVIPINKECKFKDLNYEWIYELAVNKNVYVILTDEFNNVYLRIDPLGKNIDESPESKKVIGHPLSNDFVN